MPESLVVVVVLTSRPVSVIVILAPDMTAPDESLMVPTILPYTACAWRVPLVNNKASVKADKAPSFLMDPFLFGARPTQPSPAREMGISLSPLFLPDIEIL